MIIEVDGFSFDFPEAIEAFIFDEKDANQSNYHGLSHAMKAIDCIVELPTHYLFIEVKDFFAPDDYNLTNSPCDADTKEKNKNLNILLNTLKYKYRDSWLYRWAEEKIHKPIHYLCLLTLENAQISFLQKQLRHQLPVGLPTTARWRRGIAQNCLVLNLARWQQNFPQWPVRQISP